MNMMQNFAAFSDPDLGQTFILAPELSYAKLRETLANHGFVVDSLGDQSDEDAPLTVGFTFSGARPNIIYSHNPVVDLRVLDVGTVPPGLRSQLAQDLPLLHREDVGACLSASDDKQVLLGLWAACETERVDLIDDVTALAQRRRGIVRDEAKICAEKLTKISEAREGVLGLMGMVAETALEVIQALDDPRVVQHLLVTPQLARGLFTPDITDAMARSVGSQARIATDTYQGLTVVPETIKAAPAGLLRFHNMLSKPFPRGYRDAAGWLQPDQIWLTWMCTDRGGAKTLYDGLVFTGKAWHLCPRPFRLIGAELRRRELQIEDH